MAQRDQERGTAADRGYGPAWAKARKAFLAKHPICEDCGKPADTVDHRIPHKGDPYLFWLRSNWRAVCGTCNRRKAARSEGRWGGGLESRPSEGF